MFWSSCTSNSNMISSTSSICYGRGVLVFWLLVIKSQSISPHLSFSLVGIPCKCVKLSGTVKLLSKWLSLFIEVRQECKRKTSIKLKVILYTSNIKDDRSETCLLTRDLTVGIAKNHSWHWHIVHKNNWLLNNLSHSFNLAVPSKGVVAGLTIYLYMLWFPCSPLYHLRLYPVMKNKHATLAIIFIATNNQVAF